MRRLGRNTHTHTYIYIYIYVYIYIYNIHISLLCRRVSVLTPHGLAWWLQESRLYRRPLVDLHLCFASPRCCVNAPCKYGVSENDEGSYFGGPHTGKYANFGAGIQGFTFF